MKYLDRFSITSIDDGGIFIPAENAVRFNIFHEIGHAIDYYYGMDQGMEGYYSDSFSDDGKTL